MHLQHAVLILGRQRVLVDTLRQADALLELLVCGEKRVGVLVVVVVL